ncbi:MAG: ATP-dependent DNA helicase RecG [Gracilibacteraceae bacterium]|jgi:ATP-dependent DNA helicase RecG|nr:ATP-dependent DNA helicase RecG [Gracilibacteraceae bacterium]
MELDSVERALLAERKQGYLNTGAWEGFHNYIMRIFSRCGPALTPEQSARLRETASRYGEASPWDRRALWSAISETWKEALPAVKIWNEEQADAPPPSPPAMEQPAAERPASQTTESPPPARPTGKKGTASAGALSLQYVKGVGPQRRKYLEALGIRTGEDVLRHYPRRYEDRAPRRFADLRDGETATVCGVVRSAQIRQGRLKIVTVRLEQDGSPLDAVWFNQVHIAEQYKVGDVITVTGKARLQRRVPELLASDVQKGETEEGALTPVYPETAQLSSKALRAIVRNVLPWAERLFPEYLPEEKRAEWMPRAEAFRAIHAPDSPQQAEAARRRLVMEELLFLQLALADLRRAAERSERPILAAGQGLVEDFIRALPFKLTGAQKRVLEEIFADMASARGMTRLVQGDVGSGKTVVAAAALLMAVGSGMQGAFMVPTEVLAYQHFTSLRALFAGLPVEVVLLVGAQGKKEREAVLGGILSGKAHIIVGTQAMIQEKVRYNALGLVVTDEQHRFGVRQRSRLAAKGENPHVLALSATPIPRTLALTAYGDLQLSALDEMPAGRKPVLTRHITEKSRAKLIQSLARETGKGRQAYVVCPLVAETEKIDLASAEQRAEELTAALPERRVALLHGRMSGADKEDILNRFTTGTIDVLVTTTVIEVGVNVPNATVMIIESAERFGLAQLHQLRGRVGRGGEQSYCLLVSEAKNNARLKILCQTEDGFLIAEEDLRQRGPGELLGLRQHGLPELKLADFTKDARLIEYAYRFTQDILAAPEDHAEIMAEVRRQYPRSGTALN